MKDNVQLSFIDSMYGSIIQDIERIWKSK